MTASNGKENGGRIRRRMRRYAGEGRPARLPADESVKIIVLFHAGATILITMAARVYAHYFSGFLRISSCNKP
ncbi:hypothetical protein [Burkholderia pseudomultivorans]|uniref:hypothetical protein n=1 Tax=Burkholderia pseudomultivorans TaxID=1207504 RepID=UPI001582E092|nr:hypothetical protein [Burkholderia pseudomultivorans]